VKSFQCAVCASPLFFENSVCVSCGTSLGFSRAEREIVPVDERGRYVDAADLVWWVCANLDLSGCTWLAPLEGGACFACSLTRTRPNDSDLVGLTEYKPAEEAKRHLIVELDSLGLPVISKFEDPENGLAFDLLSSVAEKVVIGHENGVITLDLAESDDAHREQVRAQLDEPYRTMLGHFRHEVGHYYEWQLVRSPATRARYRELFGDETIDYQVEIDRHYTHGPPAGWETSFLSTYATMHPFEDFAETWAHYLHISDTIETAAQQGLLSLAPASSTTFRDRVTGVWIPLAIGLNQINRSMGKDDLYPFVIPTPVLEKMAFVASLAPSA
jgi:hypothetical protein